ncbi:MAG: E3 binding domain-containing protein [Acidobacteriota bacterium]
MSTVIIYAPNEDREYLEEAHIYAAEKFPEAKLLVRNPDFYDSHQHEKADDIVIHSRYRYVIKCYRERESHVHLFDQANPVLEKDNLSDLTKAELIALAKERGIEEIQGTGSGGSVTKADLVAALEAAEG